jgi:two-component system sensor kinase FixL
MLDTVKVPREFEQIFRTVQEYVSRYFHEKNEDASKGTIEISGQRYILVRAASMSVDFFETVKTLFKDWGQEKASDIARSLLFDLAHAIGKMDARNFHEKMGLKNPIEKLSAGPVHFSHTGWAFVDIFPESKPTPDENYYLIYDHPFSFESDAWNKKGIRSDFPVCAMNAGYSSGWCEESFGIPLVASEITCRAKGDSICRFIMAHPSKIEQYLQAYLQDHPDISDNAAHYRTGGFFQERKKVEDQLRKAEERYRIQFEGALDAIFIADAETGIIIDLNPAAARLVDREKSELIGQHQRILHPPEQIEGEFSKSFKQHLKEKQGQVLETQLITKNGEIKDVAIKANLFEVRDKKIIQGIFRDITERKEAEHRQARLLHRLEKVNKELKDFAYIISHDLKAPLRGIKTLVDWISTDYADKLDEDGKEQVNLLLGRVDRMQSLIDGVLQYSRVGRVKEDLSQIDLNKLVPNIIDTLAPLENITITIENELPTIVCEKTRVIQVFQNLLSNAIKFMDKPQGQIKIGCIEENGFWRFSVADNGPGIEEKHFEKIFHMFETLSPRNGFESTGIGLTLVKRIVEMYGGEIWLQSECDLGSTFLFTLPKTIDLSVNDKQIVAASY